MRECKKAKKIKLSELELNYFPHFYFPIWTKSLPCRVAIQPCRKNHRLTGHALQFERNPVALTTDLRGTRYS